MPTLLHGSGYNLGSGRGCPLVVQYWADLQSVHGLHYYGNITRTQNVSEYMLVLTLCLVLFIMLIYFANYTVSMHVNKHCRPVTACVCFVCCEFCDFWPPGYDSVKSES